MDRNQTISILATTYTKFLNSIDHNDIYIRMGLGEGRAKFLSNLHIKLLSAEKKRGESGKYYTSDFVTEKALSLLNSGVKKKNALRYEHIVPKEKYIQSLCLQKAREGNLNEDFVRDLLDKFLWTATITTEEDSKLSNDNMPPGWDGKDIFARYKEAGIELISYNSDIGDLLKA